MLYGKISWDNVVNPIRVFFFQSLISFVEVSPMITILVTPTDTLHSFHFVYWRTSTSAKFVLLWGAIKNSINKCNPDIYWRPLNYWAIKSTSYEIRSSNKKKKTFGLFLISRPHTRNARTPMLYVYCWYQDAFLLTLGDLLKAATEKLITETRTMVILINTPLTV